MIARHPTRTVRVLRAIGATRIHGEWEYLRGWHPATWLVLVAAVSVGVAVGAIQGGAEGLSELRALLRRKHEPKMK